MKKLLGCLLCVMLLIFGVSSVGATSLDLTTAGASGYLNNAFFQQIDPQSTGTGVIEPFVRLQMNGTESGYNTDGTLEFDTKAGLWTHSLLLTDVPVVNVGGTDYRQFLLDINEDRGGDDELLSLYELEVYLGADPDLTGYPALGTLIYDLDDGTEGDSVIELNYLLNPGSGAGDMFAYIPTSLFTGPNEYVYLYSAFGTPNASTAGFEEWAVIGEGSSVPEPATMLLLGSGILGLALFGRQRFK